MLEATQTERRTPTLSEMRSKWHGDLQLEGLQILAEAARSSRPADYISHMLDVIRDSHHPREATYLIEFVLHHAADPRRGGLLGN